MKKKKLSPKTQRILKHAAAMKKKSLAQKAGLDGSSIPFNLLLITDRAAAAARHTGARWALWHDQLRLACTCCVPAARLARYTRARPRAARRECASVRVSSIISKIQDMTLKGDTTSIIHHDYCRNANIAMPLKM